MYDEFSASNSTGSFPVQRGIPNGPSSCHKTNPKVRYDGSISGTELHCHRHDIKISKRKQKQGACSTRSPCTQNDDTSLAATESCFSISSVLDFKKKKPLY